MTTKLTRQGVRYLGGGGQRRFVAYVCPHLWETATDWEAYPEPVVHLRCSLCRDIRR